MILARERQVMDFSGEGVFPPPKQTLFLGISGT